VPLIAHTYRRAVQRFAATMNLSLSIGQRRTRRERRVEQAGGTFLPAYAG
jgi:hypothetical protein